MRAEVSPQHGTPYGMSREPILSPSQLPCTPPPWAVLTGVDLSTGTIRWEVPLGTTAESLPIDPNGKQFLVIAAGGHGKLPIRLGDSLVAFTLP